MGTVTLTINKNDLAALYKKAAQVERNLTNKTGYVYKYVFKIGDGYRQAVLSGIGQTTTGVMSLKQFLGSVESTNWKPNADKTVYYKANLGWSLDIWKATGAVEDVMNDPSKSIRIDQTSSGIDMFSGIDGAKFAEAFDHAYRTEFGGTATEEPHSKFAGRALFTLLNKLLVSRKDVVLAGLNDAISKSIAKSGWGS